MTETPGWTTGAVPQAIGRHAAADPTLGQTARSTITSASALPASSAPDPALQSYRVHLGSLQDFARELDGQLDGLTAPTEGLARVSGSGMALGAFDEANGFVAAQHDALTQMQALLADVRQAISFASEVTRTVSAGYSQADSAVAQGLGGAPAGTAPVGTAPVGTAPVGTAPVVGVPAPVEMARQLTAPAAAAVDQTVRAVVSLPGDLLGGH